MGHSNRGRVTVNLGGNWRLYSLPLNGWEMVGTVQRGQEIGALAKTPAGIYVQINAGAINALDQRKIAAAFDVCKG